MGKRGEGQRGDPPEYSNNQESGFELNLKDKEKKKGGNPDFFPPIVGGEKGRFKSKNWENFFLVKKYLIRISFKEFKKKFPPPFSPKKNFPQEKKNF
ncbi:MAG: hypothetical protein IPL59_03785 [Candidatus Competibacteraceae bacterium]|nr:hypothetical protein [Candidatus Competibacteraceae bacterium]